MSSDKVIAKRIVKKWIAELDSKDRSMMYVYSNFDELFTNMKDANISFEVCESFIVEAITAHLPGRAIAGITYKQGKARMGNPTFQEFMDDWKKSINNKAYQAFYDSYPIEGVEEKKEKKHGNMSGQEYNKQRKYAESFPLLDIEELKRQREEAMLKELSDGEA